MPPKKRPRLSFPKGHSTAKLTEEERERKRLAGVKRMRLKREAEQQNRQAKVTKFIPVNMPRKKRKLLTRRKNWRLVKLRNAERAMKRLADAKRAQLEQEAAQQKLSTCFNEEDPLDMPPKLRPLLTFKKGYSKNGEQKARIARRRASAEKVRLYREAELQHHLANFTEDTPAIVLKKAWIRKNKPLWLHLKNTFQQMIEEKRLADAENMWLNQVHAQQEHPATITEDDDHLGDTKDNIEFVKVEPVDHDYNDDDQRILPDAGPSYVENITIKTEIKMEPDDNLELYDEIYPEVDTFIKTEEFYSPDCKPNTSETVPARLHEYANCGPKPIDLTCNEEMGIPDSAKYAELKEMLPQSFKHKIKKEYAINEKIIDVSLFTNVFDGTDAYIWIAEFENKTRSTYTITSTPAMQGTKIIFKQYRHCHHKTRWKKANSAENRNKRNTNCPSKLTITVRRELKRNKGRDTHVRGMPCVIYIFWKHNHPTESSEVLRFRPVSKEVRQKLADLFKRGYSVTAARNSLKLDLQRDHPSDYVKYLADRFYYPNYVFCHYYYKKQLRESGSFVECDVEINDGDDLELDRFCQEGQDSIEKPSRPLPGTSDPLSVLDT